MNVTMLQKHYLRRSFLRLLGWAGLAMITRPAPAATDFGERYVCTTDECNPFYYDPAVGDPDYDVPPGTPFKDLPKDWICPICGWTQSKFIPESEYIKMSTE